MKIRNIAGKIEEIIPLKLAQDWDNVGLLIVSTSAGIMTNADARENQTGGRLIAYVY